LEKLKQLREQHNYHLNEEIIEPSVSSKVDRNQHEDNREENREENLCKICFERNKCILTLPCKHISMCDVCADMVNDVCPICRTTIDSKMKVFSV